MLPPPHLPPPRTRSSSKPTFIPRSHPVSSSSPKSLCQSEASTTSQPKSRELPSPLVLTKTVSKCKHNPAACIKITNQAATHEDESSASTPKDPRSPTRPFICASNKSVNEEEPPGSSQTAGEPFKKQLNVTGAVEDKETTADFLPRTERKRGRASRRSVKEAEAYAEQFQSSGKSDQISRKALPTGVLTGSSSVKKEASALQRREENHKDRQIITEEFPETTTPEDRRAQKRLCSFKSNKHDKSKAKTRQSVQKVKSEMKENVRKNVKELNRNSNNVSGSYFEKEQRGAPKREYDITIFRHKISSKDHKS
ncbi:uncharacterized protein LOC112450327 [Kryptolebias marmoratus]|uniref:uncharacterized protein LOC112450327 n=1 Tax=Kryptolebias marmoratus TaxID=37003 RepID=UPI000D530EDB|nr:uncharacterized protein LOC112450327 [Kryptolebias marmoratus]